MLFWCVIYLLYIYAPAYLGEFIKTLVSCHAQSELSTLQLLLRCDQALYFCLQAFTKFIREGELQIN